MNTELGRQGSRCKEEGKGKGLGHGLGFIGVAQWAWAGRAQLLAGLSVVR